MSRKRVAERTEAGIDTVEPEPKRSISLESWQLKTVEWYGLGGVVDF